MVTRRFALAACVALLLIPVAAQAAGLPDPGKLTGYRDRVGQQFTFTVTGYQLGYVWGTDIYTDDSDLAVAAVHAGLLAVGETGDVTVEILPGQDHYEGSNRNGVQSIGYDATPGAYRFVR